jgi:integrase
VVDGRAKTHGYTPEWTSSNMLAAASRQAVQSIDLHFHDLRHEAGSRWLEAGWPLHHVQAMLGHANLSQTSTYLNATKTGLHDSMKRFEEFAPGCNPVAINPQIDPSRDCNDEASAAGKLSVN